MFDGKYRLFKKHDRNVDYSRITTRRRLQGRSWLWRNGHYRKVTDNDWILEMETKIKNGVKSEWTKSAANEGQIVRVVLESLASTYLETITQVRAGDKTRNDNC